jgi:hypothetical protein
MHHILDAAVFAFVLLLGMLLFLEVGRRLGVRKLREDPEGARSGTGAIEGAVFALLGLLIAFTFSGAASRFDQRRDLVVEEANDIGTAWLRLDLLPAKAQPALRDAFRQYVDARIATYRRIPDVKAVQAETARAARLQQVIWAKSVAAAGTAGAAPGAPMLLLPALNAMIDITTTRTMTTELHPPVVIFGMLFVLALVSALLAGYAMAGGRSRHWLHAFGFAAIAALAVYVILDIEFPRLGLIRVDAFDHALRELRNSMR